MASSGVWENVILTKINTTMYGTKMMMMQDHKPTTHIKVVGTLWDSLHYLASWCCGPCAVDQGIEQDLVQNVGQLVLSNIPVRCWIIDPNKHSPLGGPCEGMWLPTHSGEILKPGMMIWGLSMALMMEGALSYSFNLSPKVLGDSPMYSSSHSYLSHL